MAPRNYDEGTRLLSTNPASTSMSSSSSSQAARQYHAQPCNNDDEDDDHHHDDNDFEQDRKEQRKFSSILTELQIQLQTVVPALQSLVLSKIPWFITLRFLGSFGAQELASAALATTLNNVTGLSFCVGFSFALSTLALRPPQKKQER